MYRMLEKRRPGKQGRLLTRVGIWVQCGVGRVGIVGGKGAKGAGGDVAEHSVLIQDR